MDVSRGIAFHIVKIYTPTQPVVYSICRLASARQNALHSPTSNNIGICGGKFILQVSVIASWIGTRIKPGYDVPVLVGNVRS